MIFGEVWVTIADIDFFGAIMKTGSKVLATLAGALFFFGAEARADILWTVDGTFTDGTTVTGTFSINQYGFLDNNFSLTTHANGAFGGFTYTASDSYFSNGTFYVDAQPGYQQDLHLQFLDALTALNPNNPIVGGNPGPSYECIDSFSCYNQTGGTIRYIETGFAAAVPEASTWLMFLIGMVGIGWVRLRRNRAVLFRLA